MAKSFTRGATIGTVSALALAIAGQASAASFDAGNTKVTLSGYVKGDMIFSTSEDLGTSFAIGGINTGADETNEVEGHFLAHARQTRLHIGTSTPTDKGDLTTMIQGDFFGAGGNEVASNSYGFRIRHAFGQWNGIGVGQTWSNFMPLVALPSTLDFAGPAGYIFNRQAQLRYTTGGLSVALENAEARVVGTTDDKDALPDVTVRYTGKSGDLNYSASGVVTFLGTDDGTNDDTATGFGAMFAAANSSGGTTIGGNIGYFDGANRYLWHGFGGQFSNAIVDGSGDIKTVGELAVMAYIDQALSDKTNALIAVGYSKLDQDSVIDAFNAGEAIEDRVAEKFTTLHVNLRHKPTKALTVGAELQYGKKEMFDGTDGDATTVQFSGQFAF